VEGQWRVRGSLGEIQVTLALGGTAADTGESARLLHSLLHDVRYGHAGARAAVAAILAQLRRSPHLLEGQHLNFGDVRFDALADELVHAARLGVLKAERLEARPVASPLEDVPEPEPLGPPSSRPDAELSWVEIELLDEEGLPVAGRSYVLELPDGATRSGSLDSRGRAMVRGIAPGQCKVTFPDLDRDAWSPS
jgi:hypothetical protein